MQLFFYWQIKKKLEFLSWGARMRSWFLGSFCVNFSQIVTDKRENRKDGRRMIAIWNWKVFLVWVFTIELLLQLRSDISFAIVIDHSNHRCRFLSDSNRWDDQDDTSYVCATSTRHSLSTRQYCWWRRWICIWCPHKGRYPVTLSW